MTIKKLKRYGLEGIAKTLIAIGLLLILSSWLVGAFYIGSVGITALLAPFIFTCVSAVLILAIRYRYTLFEKYPYLMNLPSIFYRIEDKKGSNNQSAAFSMIFTVHALVMAFLGLLSLVLTVSIVSSIGSKPAALTSLYAYLAIIVILLVSVLWQYRRIYMKFAE